MREHKGMNNHLIIGHRAIRAMIVACSAAERRHATIDTRHFSLQPVDS